MNLLPTPLTKNSANRLKSNEQRLLNTTYQLLQEIEGILELDNINTISLNITEFKENTVEIQAGMIFFVYEYDIHTQKIDKSVKAINSSIKVDLDYLLAHSMISTRTSMDISDLLELLDSQIKSLIQCKNSLLIWDMFATNKSY